jgi:hypothetical protein
MSMKDLKEAASSPEFSNNRPEGGWRQRHIDVAKVGDRYNWQI